MQRLQSPRPEEQERDLGTHADVQVLTQVLQEAGAQAQSPRPLVALRGLDPRPQVLEKRGLHTGAAQASQEAEACARRRVVVLPCLAVGPAGPVRAGHPLQLLLPCHSVLLAWPTEVQGAPGSRWVPPLPPTVLETQPPHARSPGGQEARVWGTCRLSTPACD